MDDLSNGMGSHLADARAQPTSDEERQERRKRRRERREKHSSSYRANDGQRSFSVERNETSAKSDVELDDTGSTLCEVCEKRRAELWCEQCEDMLFCPKCADVDHSKGRRKTHTLLPISQAPQVQHHKYQRCRDHGEKIKAFCEDCRKCVCALCLHIGSHEGHKAVSLEVAFRRTRESLRGQAEALVKERHRVESFIDDLDNLASKVEARAGRLRDKLASACDGFRAILVDREAHLAAQLAETESEKLATIARQRRRWADISNDVARARKVAEAALVESHPVAFLRMADEFEQQMHAIEMASAKRRAASATSDDFGLELDVPRISALLKEGVAFWGVAASGRAARTSSSQDAIAGRLAQLSLMASPQPRSSGLDMERFLSPEGRRGSVGGMGADASVGASYVDLLAEMCQADYEKNGRSMSRERFVALLRAMLQRVENGVLRQLPDAATHGRGLRVLADHLLLDMEASGLQEASMSDNAFVFLPSSCVDAAGGSLVANLVPAGDSSDARRASAASPHGRGYRDAPARSLWLGRMWQLQDALKAQRGRGGPPALSGYGGGQLGGLMGGEPAALEREEERRRADAALRIQRSWRGQRARADNTFAALKVFKACNIRGVVIYATSSTGLCGQDLRYCRMLAGMGYLVLVPDAMASASRSGPRLRAPRVELSLDDNDDEDGYWLDDPLLTQIGTLVRQSQVASPGQGAEGPHPRYLLEEPSTLHRSLPKYFAVRSAEVAYTLRSLPSFLRRWGVFLMGAGEGGMVVAHMPLPSGTGADDRDLIAGRVVCSYSWEPNCFSAALVPPPATGGGRANPASPARAPPSALFEFSAAQRMCPVLNIVGSHDEFFGSYDSVAAAVAAGGRSPGEAARDASTPSDALDGHGYPTLLAGGAEAGLVAQLQGGGHDLTLTHGGALRELLVTFLSKPRRCFLLDKLWEVEPSLHTLIQQHTRSGGVLFVQIKQQPPRAGSRSAGRGAMSDARGRLALWQGSDASPLHSSGGLYPRNEQLVRDLSTRAIGSLQHPSGAPSPGKHLADFGEASLRGSSSLRGYAADMSPSGSLFDSRKFTGGAARPTHSGSRTAQPVSRRRSSDVPSDYTDGVERPNEVDPNGSPSYSSAGLTTAPDQGPTFELGDEPSSSHVPPHLAHLAGADLTDSLDVA